MIIFNDYKNLIFKEAWYYSTKFNVDVGDVIGEAYLLYHKAVETYKPSKGAFTTHLVWRLKELGTYCTKESKALDVTVLDVEFITVEAEIHSEVAEVFEVLSKEGKLLASGILEGVFDIINPLRQTPPGKFRIIKKCKELFDWPSHKTEKVFNEVQVCWGRVT